MSYTLFCREYNRLHKYINASLPSFPKGTPHPISPFEGLISPSGLSGPMRLWAGGKYRKYSILTNSHKYGLPIFILILEEVQYVIRTILPYGS